MWNKKHNKIIIYALVLVIVVLLFRDAKEFYESKKEEPEKELSAELKKHVDPEVEKKVKERDISQEDIDNIMKVIQRQ